MENAHRRELQNLLAQDALDRLWAKDAALWPTEEHEKESVSRNLDWLDLPDRLGPLMARVVARASEIEPAGFEDVVFVTLGSSSLAAEAVLQLPSARLGKRTFLLDSVDPDAIRRLEADLQIQKTLFIFASKSGKYLDAHALLLYFLERLRVAGVSSAPRHFVALAEEDSYLSQLAGEYQFIDSFFDPPGIHGRYSSLIHFNFFLATVGHLDPADLLTRAQSMREACGPATRNEANPALSLGALLAAAEVEGLHRLALLPGNAPRPIAYRVGQLVGASTCKGGGGIVPVFGRDTYPLEMLRQGFLVACLQIAGADQQKGQQELEKKSDELRGAGVPVVSIEWSGPKEFGAELFKWEIATALACSILGVNPFLDPDTRDGRARVAELLEQIADKKQLPSATVRVREAEVELYGEGETRREISTLNMAEALRSFFALRRQDGYLALLPFLDANPARSVILRRIAELLEMRLGIPVLVTSGPRYLHNLGQVYHGGPATGLFVVITANSEKDLAIPGAEYSFGQLQQALALADFECLGRRRRPVIRLHLTGGAENGLAQLEAILNNTPGMRGPSTR